MDGGILAGFEEVNKGQSGMNDTQIKVTYTWHNAM